MFNKLRNNSKADNSTTRPPGANGIQTVLERAPRDSLALIMLENQKPTVISPNFTLRGDIESSGTLHVEGVIIGTVVSDQINISETGRIEGEVLCTSLNIKGFFTGTAVCEELVVASSAQVDGHLTYKFLTVGTGARLQGDMVVSTP